jgi:hypothetical protein
MMGETDQTPEGGPIFIVTAIPPAEPSGLAICSAIWRWPLAGKLNHLDPRVRIAYHPASRLSKLTPLNWAQTKRIALAA